MDQPQPAQPTPTLPPLPAAPTIVVPGSTAPPAPQTTQTLTGVEYAGFGQRFLASLIDGIVVGIVIAVIGGIGGVAAALFQSETVMWIATLVAQIISLVIAFGYYIYFIGSRGQTLGKMALKIKVIKTDSLKPPGYFGAFLRESVGKIISAIVLCLGYYWMLWDKKKQTWHDKIANTIVVKA